MYKLEFKLKQHTPLIHFQHDQHGATLRATELKPKLDKFLIDRLKLTEIKEKKTVPKKEYENWFSDKVKLSLDYKVKITATKESKLTKLKPSQNREKKWQTNNYPCFFANMGLENKEELKNFSMFDDIKVTITCFIDDLRKEIDKNLNNFFSITNFGTRQNKGFGSFYIDEEDKLYKEISLNYYFLTIQNTTNIEDIFEVIKYYYQRLKSGINYKYTDKQTNKQFKHYKDSFLKLYVSKNTDYKWEKRWLKENFIDLTPDKENKKFGRAFLGLVDNYTFNPLKNKNQERPNEVYPHRKTIIDVKSVQNIERIKSPITFKPFKVNNEWRIYIIPSKLSGELKDKEFRFKTKRATKSIHTPEKLLNIEDLIKEYNIELKSQFTAYDFTGKKEFKVKINQ